MPQRPCINCGRLHRNTSRCDACTAAKATERGSSAQRGYGAQWRALRKRVLDKHLAVFGPLCLGYGVPAHYSEALTVDHVVPKVKGGSDALDNLSVLCRSCNSRKRDHYQG